MSCGARGELNARTLFAAKGSFGARDTHEAKKGSKEIREMNYSRQIEYWFVLGNCFSYYFHYRNLESTGHSINFKIIHSPSESKIKILLD